MRGVANQVLMLLAYGNNYKWGSKMFVGSMPRAESACSLRVSRFSAFPPESKYESLRISQMFRSNDLHKWWIVGEENVQVLTMIPGSALAVKLQQICDLHAKTNLQAFFG